ncbi:universal stress protein [Oceanicoccus sagamiensis]|uniref:Universal stress protein UspA n=1 Tax=Oceanicoccus sagamiensis TaxID=716816 RepID=A0A1X9NBF0_9GAMM|nr:universal stress protein [Oceanicoccus sagamiensis]ARN74491.1 universal stress protein UspA [Oceanicoccus sagamiensis]
MKKLLVIADKTGGKNIALARAANLQAATGAKIILRGYCYVNIHNPEDLKLAKLSRSQLEKQVVAKRQQELEKIAKQLKIKPKNIDIKAVWGKDISQAITTLCNKHKIDMVIKSAHRSETFLYTSTDWQLLRTCAPPVMITASKSWKKKPRIVASLDFSTKLKAKIALNHKVFKHAQELAEALGQEVHIAHAITMPQALIDMDIINAKDYISKRRKEIKLVSDAFCKEYGLDTSCVHLKAGPADKVIPSIANKLKADVVVTGTVARKGIKGKLMGNTVEGILSRLHTDIIAIKP